VICVELSHVVENVNNLVPFTALVKFTEGVETNPAPEITSV
jgi:hypothetical protein